MPNEKHEGILTKKHKLDRFTIIYIMMLIMLINLGYNTAKNAKPLFKQLYMGSNPSAECVQVLNYIDDNDVGFQEDFRAISTALLHPDDCPEFIQDALEKIASSFFSEQLFENIDAQILNGTHDTRFIVVNRNSLTSDAAELGLDPNALIGALGVPIGSSEVSDEFVTLAQIYPLDLSNTRAILSNGRDRNTSGTDIDEIFRIWVAQPTTGDEEDAQGNNRGYTQGMFPQFIRLNGNSLAEYDDAVNDVNRMWVTVNQQGRYQVLQGPINPEQYSAAPFLWNWDLTVEGANFFANSLGNGRQDYLTRSMESERIGDDNFTDKKPMTGIALMSDGSVAVISLPYYMFTDAALTTFIGQQLQGMGVVSVGFGDLKLSASGEGVIDPLHPKTLPVSASGAPVPDPFANGGLYLTIITP